MALLHEVLGLALIPHDQVGGAKQLIDVCDDELVKFDHHPC